ncbi:Twin-arginine translocation protein TatC [Caballeronia sordidicola]|uniref:Twin-arginine translocation protein TatC n=1 Tax=Caballeronia sordidicola TaxID=196367 RepID=A0A242MI35_CABSO|nr:Twin-arginine translocation protein TatC [Caballeronia sordidicola]
MAVIVGQRRVVRQAQELARQAECHSKLV